jgi:hypothetical protein
MQANYFFRTIWKYPLKHLIKQMPEIKAIRFRMVAYKIDLKKREISKSSQTLTRIEVKK